MEETLCGHDWVDCPEHDGGYDCTPFCATCEGNQGYCPTCDGTLTHCGKPVEWALHEHGDPLNDPCYAWVCAEGDASSDYDCGEDV